MSNKAQFQTLLDEFGKACAAHDSNRVLMLRRTIDKKLEELFDDLQKARTAKPQTPRPPTPTPPPRPKPNVPTSTPPRYGPCPNPKCVHGRVEDGNAILRCRECDGEGRVLVAKGTTPYDQTIERLTNLFDKL